MKHFKRITASVCLFSLLLMTAACGGGGGGDDGGSGDKGGKSESGKAATQGQYKASFFDIPAEITDVSRLLLRDGNAYLCCAEGESASYIGSLSLADGSFTKLPVNSDAALTLLDFAIGGDGGLSVLCRDAAGGSYSLKAFDMSGAELQTIELQNVVDTTGAQELFLSADSDGNLAVAVKGERTRVYVLSGSGELLFELEDEGNLLTTLTTAEGKIGVCATGLDRVNYNLLTVDVAKKGWGDAKTYLGTTVGVYGGIAESFYLFDSSDLYGYSEGESERRSIFSWSAAGLGTADVQLAETDDGSFVVLAAQWSQSGKGGYQLALLAPGQDERTVLTMTSLSAAPSIVQAVSSFNRRSADYRIVLEEYFPYEQNVSDEDWEQAVLKLNTEIITGKIPDILDLNGLPSEIFWEKGLLEDLYPYIENDPDIDMDDYFGNVFKALEIDGGLPFITDGVVVYTMLAAKSQVASDSGWTIAELADLRDREGAAAVGNLSGESLVRIMLQTDGGRYIDWQSKTCSFDSEEFIALLELAKAIGGGNMEGFAGGGEQTMYPAVFETVMSVYHAAKWQNLYRDELNIVGLPGDGEAVRSAIRPETMLAVTTAGEHKDGAWDFVSMLLEPKQQSSCFTLPIHRAAFDSVMATAMEGGSSWEFVYGEGEYKISQADCELTRELLEGASAVVRVNESLEEIVMEELSGFLSGMNTAEQTAASIQSRASLYVNEQG